MDNLTQSVGTGLTHIGGNQDNSLVCFSFPYLFFFYKNKMIFIHSNREITSFNTAKNVKDESVNKLTTSKLIAYNGIMPTKIYDKSKVTGISMASGSAVLTLKYLIE